MSSKQGGRKKGRKSGKKEEQKQNPRKQKQKVSTGDGRKRGGRKETKGKKSIDIAKARLELIIRSKFQNPRKAEASPLESKVCQLLVDLEASSRDLKPFLRDLGIVSAREMVVSPNKKAVVIFVPFHQHSRWKKLQDRLVRELEKKFSEQDVLFIAQRKIMKLCVCPTKIHLHLLSKKCICCILRICDII